MRASKAITRRGFLSASMRTAATIAAGPLLLTSCATTGRGRVSPNERIGVGVIGVGRRGQQLMGLPEGAEIVAISDVNRDRLEKVAAGKGWRTYRDYRDLLESRDVDAVIVATPDHWHALNVVHACEAGKDVYVEKPLSLTVREGRAMVKAARRHKRVVQTGSQQRSMGACRLACELVRNGRVGKVHTVHAGNYPSPWECNLPAQPVPDGLDWDTWCGQTEPRPYHEELYAPRVRGHEAGWISYRPYSGGEMTGWGAHGLDIIQWALGMDETGPVEIRALAGTEPQNDRVHRGPTCEVMMRYANGIVLHLDGNGPDGGGVFVGDDGEIMITRGKFGTNPPEIAQEPLSDSDVRLYQSEHHLGNWIECIRTRERPVADVEIGHRTATVCHPGNIARWTNRPLRWDPEKERFVGDKEANALLERPMRRPWRL